MDNFTNHRDVSSPVPAASGESMAHSAPWAHRKVAILGIVCSCLLNVFGPPAITLLLLNFSPGLIHDWFPTPAIWLGLGLIVSFFIIAFAVPGLLDSSLEMMILVGISTIGLGYVLISVSLTVMWVGAGAA